MELIPPAPDPPCIINTSGNMELIPPAPDPPCDINIISNIKFLLPSSSSSLFPPREPNKLPRRRLWVSTTSSAEVPTTSSAEVLPASRLVPTTADTTAERTRTKEEVIFLLVSHEESGVGMKQ